MSTWLERGLVAKLILLGILKMALPVDNHRLFNRILSLITHWQSNSALRRPVRKLHHLDMEEEVISPVQIILYALGLPHSNCRFPLTLNRFL